MILNLDKSYLALSIFKYIFFLICLILIIFFKKYDLHQVTSTMWNIQVYREGITFNTDYIWCQVNWYNCIYEIYLIRKILSVE